MIRVEKLQLTKPGILVFLASSRYGKLDHKKIITPRELLYPDIYTDFTIDILPLAQTPSVDITTLTTPLRTMEIKRGKIFAVIYDTARFNENDVDKDKFIMKDLFGRKVMTEFTLK